MKVSRFLGALLGVLVAASTSFAQVDQRSLPEQLLERFGQTADLTQDEALKKALVERGLIPSTARKVTIDGAFVRRAAGNEAFWNDVRKIRYHVGDRVWITKERTRPHSRAEITKVNADGTYTLRVWSRTNAPGHSERVDAATGLPPGWDPKEVTRDSVHTRIVTHDYLDRLNGYVDPGKGGDYLVYGLPDGGTYAKDVDLVSPSRDPELKKAIAYGRRLVDDALRSGELDLTIPADPALAEKKLEEIAKVQRRIFLDLYDRMAIHGDTDYPHSETTLFRDGKRLIGSYKLADSGQCSARAQWLTAIVREVGRRIGIEIRGVRSSYHSQAHLRFADGSRYMSDPYYEGEDTLTPLDEKASTFELFPDPGVAAEDRVPFAGVEERAKLLAGGLPRSFFDRLAALERGEPDPARSRRAIVLMTADELVRAARDGGARAIGADLVTRANVPLVRPSVTRGTAGALSQDLIDRVQAGTSRARGR